MNIFEPGLNSLIQCSDCGRFESQGGTCEAFPDGIPVEIQRNEFDHRKPHQDDNRLLFVPKSLEASDRNDDRFNELNKDIISIGVDGQNAFLDELKNVEQRKGSIQ